MRTLLDTGQWAPCFSPSRSWLSADKATGRDRIGAHWTMRSTGNFVRRSRTSTETRGGSAPSAAAVSSAKGKKVIEAFPCKGQPGLSAYSRTLTSTFASFGSGPKERSTSVPAKGEAKAWQLRHQQTRSPRRLPARTRTRSNPAAAPNKIPNSCRTAACIRLHSQGSPL